ncbi:hypothetical protein TWF730_000287 [Orbilia blumenaviensis]|uniref:BTB domain-containing protein n=1 Tax=Orbilia blumenaviensis TaxID=1796055 RepID=A0AAV9VS94_9PEZI
MLPAPAPRSTNVPSCNFILPSFNNPTFSDLTILSGPSKISFHVHKVIVSATSNFFKTCCNAGNYSNNGSQIIELPNIPPTVLQTILLWQYGQPYVLPPNPPPLSSGAQETKAVGKPEGNDESFIITTYSAAAYLQIALLQTTILAVIADEFRFRPWIRFTRPVDFIDALCNNNDSSCLQIYKIEPITATTASATRTTDASTGMFPAACYSGNVNRVRTRDEHAAIIECVSVMVASHNFKDLANEIETLKNEKLKVKKEEAEGATRGLDDDPNDIFFTVILPVWEDFVRKKEEKRVLDPRNDPRVFRQSKTQPKAPKIVYRLIDLSVLVGFVWLVYHYWEISSFILGWASMIFGICCFLVISISMYRLHRQGVWSW